MNLTPIFTRANGVVADLHPLRFAPLRYTKSSMGGPKSCEIAVEGTEDEIWNLTSILRYGVQILDDYGDLCWHGYVDEVRLNINGIEWSLSLQNMANRVRMKYTTIAEVGVVGGQQRITAWYDDVRSQGMFGTKEAVLIGNDLTDDAAVTRALSELVMLRYPMPKIEFAESEEINAKIICKGWIDTLAWRYYYYPSGGLRTIAYVVEPETTTLDIGTSASQRVAQEITVGSAGQGSQLMTMVRAKVAKIGAPADALTVEVWSSTGSAPQTLLGYARINAGGIAASHTWTEFTQWTEDVQFTAGAAVWLVWTRSGGLDNANHYRIATNTAAGYSGRVRTWDGSAWVAPGTDVDTLFEANAVPGAESTAQILTIAQTAGQFFSAITVESASGVYLANARSGDYTARKEIDNLLAIGGAGGVRLLMDVDRDRRLRVYPEPTPAQATITIDRRLNILGRFGDQMPRYKCPVATWLELNEPLPGGVLGTDYFSAALSFVDEAEYDVAQDRWRPVSRRFASPYAFAAIGGGGFIPL